MIAGEKTHIRGGGETGLWCAVVEQAFEDAFAPKCGDGRQEQSRARVWLLGRSIEFKTVCWLAGLDPDFIHRRAHSLENPFGDGL